MLQFVLPLFTIYLLFKKPLQALKSNACINS